MFEKKSENKFSNCTILANIFSKLHQYKQVKLFISSHFLFAFHETHFFLTVIDLN